MKITRRAVVVAAIAVLTVIGAASVVSLWIQDGQHHPLAFVAFMTGLAGFGVGFYRLLGWLLDRYTDEDGNGEMRLFLPPFGFRFKFTIKPRERKGTEEGQP